LFCVPGQKYCTSTGKCVAQDAPCPCLPGQTFCPSIDECLEPGAFCPCTGAFCPPPPCTWCTLDNK
jgi:hypothetical protein